MRRRGSLEDLLSDPAWLLDVEVDAPEDSGFADALLHLSNSYQGVRVTPDLDDLHADPGLFAIDVYDAGVGVAREIVTLPTPLGVRIRHGYQVLRSPAQPRRVLDMRNGWAYLDRVLIAQDGRKARLSTLTAVHATKPRTGVLFGALRLPAGMRSVALELYWDNTTGNPYLGGAVPSLRKFHVSVEQVVSVGRTLELVCRLAGTGAQLRLLSRARCSNEIQRLPLQERQRWGHTIVAQPGLDGLLSFDLVWRVEAGSGPTGGTDAQDVWALLREHQLEWHRRWTELAIDIDGDDLAQQSMRFGLFNLLQNELPPRRRKITPARGLSSGYHSGSTFFDTELHKDAYWAWSVPEVAKSHLDFRYETLPEARAFARRIGFAGARFPEAANDVGAENGPHDILSYPEDGRITEWSVKEVIHISADVAYAVHRYHQVTGDAGFMAHRGVQLVLETARFAASVLQWCEQRRAYVVRSVMGPDEYHYHVDNNHFTNVMLRWNLEYALALIAGTGQVDRAHVDEVRQRVGVDDAEVRTWASIAASVHVPPALPGGVPAQHEGYERLVDCPPRRDAAGPAARLTEDEAGLAAALKDFPTKLIKQADVVLLMHLLPDVFDEDTVRRAFAYYEPRTAHESSLSAAPHGVVAARLGLIDLAYDFFLRAARYNLDYQPRAHYRNGLHLSAYAGAWQIVAEGFLGLSVADDGALELRPQLPGNWRGLVVPLRLRGRRLRVSVRDRAVFVTCLEGPGLEVRVAGQARAVTRGRQVRFESQ
jgi:trehalose/maltose hydrolase-like predicted phosphorylase